VDKTPLAKEKDQIRIASFSRRKRTFSPAGTLRERILVMPKNGYYNKANSLFVAFPPYKNTTINHEGGI
jgi:hypothetical protein